MKKGLVFGKFFPFHRGHQALIDFALMQCDHLVVLVCGSTKESITADQRALWISEVYQTNAQIKIQVLTYNERELPNTSQSSREVSKLWASKFKQLVPDIQVIVTSEPYGDYVAEYMNIQHIPFDVNRQEIPISATRIRNDPYRYWEFLASPVQRFLQRKVVFLGSESTGKSTISKTLSSRYRCSLVEEIGRKVIPDSSDFSEVELNKIAHKHAMNIKEAEQTLSPLIFIDTDIHITQSYALYRFGRLLDVPNHVVQTNKADLYLYLEKDLPYHQDGTRLPEPERNSLDGSHKVTLQYFGIDSTSISGSWDSRLETCASLIDGLIDTFRIN